jgi:hypothetical protein
MAVLGAEGASRAAGPMDARTVVNSILGAYGLPGVGVATGLRTYGEAEDDDFAFEHPRAWVARPNRERAGVGVADYQSSRKAWVEEFPLPEGYAALADADAKAQRRALAAAAVEALLRPGAPGGEVGGDSRIQLPPPRAVKILDARVNADDGRECLLLSFPSAATTRSGYDVRRKTFAAAVGRASRSAWMDICIVTLYCRSVTSRGGEYGDARRACQRAAGVTSARERDGREREMGA